MKFIFLMILFFNLTFAQSYTLNENLTEDNLTKYIKYFVTPSTNNLTPKEILESSPLLNLENSEIEFNPNNSV